MPETLVFRADRGSGSWMMAFCHHKNNLFQIACLHCASESQHAFSSGVPRFFDELVLDIRVLIG